MRFASPRWLRTMICKPESNIGCEKSNSFSRSEVIEMAAMPTSAPPAFTFRQQLPDAAVCRVLGALFKLFGMASHKSMLKPTRRPFS
jgi:hypothetical protein